MRIRKFLQEYTPTFCYCTAKELREMYEYFIDDVVDCMHIMARRINMALNAGSANENNESLFLALQSYKAAIALLEKKGW